LETTVSAMVVLPCELTNAEDSPRDATAVDDGDDWLLVIWNNLLSLSGTGKL